MPLPSFNPVGNSGRETPEKQTGTPTGAGASRPAPRGIPTNLFAPAQQQKEEEWEPLTDNQDLFEDSLPELDLFKDEIEAQEKENNKPSAKERLKETFSESPWTFDDDDELADDDDDLGFMFSSANSPDESNEAEINQQETPDNDFSFMFDDEEQSNDSLTTSSKNSLAAEESLEESLDWEDEDLDNWGNLSEEKFDFNITDDEEKLVEPEQEVETFSFDLVDLSEDSENESTPAFSFDENELSEDKWDDEVEDDKMPTPSFSFDEDDLSDEGWEDDDVKDEHPSGIMSRLEEFKNTPSEDYRQSEPDFEPSIEEPEPFEEFDTEEFTPPPPLSKKKKEKEYEDEESEEEEEQADDEESEDSVSLGQLIKGPFIVLGNLYRLIVKLVFGVITFVLKILSKFPIIGRFVAPVLGMTKLLEKIATALPIVGILAGVIIFNFLAVPSSVTAELPDFGSVKVSDMKYDANAKEITASVENTGVVIAEIQIDFEVKANEIKLNPLTWMKPKTIGECSSDILKINIEDTQEIKVACDIDVTGLKPRVTGVVK